MGLLELDLSGSWQFRLATSPYPVGVPAGLDAWMPATVPGTVHQDLLARGTIRDPFAGMNEETVQWVDRQRWSYRREFEVSGALAGASRVELVAEGLDTYAELRVNGKPVGRAENMFIAHRFDVKRAVRPGTNVIEVTFDSPTERSRALERAHGPLKVALESHRVYVRKAQYSFSWDWGPKLTTSGIWRPIRLEAADHPVLREPFVRVLKAGPTEARLRASIGVDGRWRQGLTVELAITGPDADLHRRTVVRSSSASGEFILSRPHLWWPNGYGAQPIYHAEFILKDGDTVLQTVRTPFAVRTVQLIQDRDNEGRSFVIRVNGVPVFCKGADWIPSDSFLPRIPESTYERLLTLARDAHMNMVRVWGGGIYEQDVFYELCDRLGLMVWQDFMFACGEYPEERWFLRSVEEEARAVVSRLRNHPSIVLWCGNNECEWLYCTDNPGASPDDMSGAVIFRDTLRKVVKELDGTRPYWRSSPFGSGFPNAVSNGNRHQWEVWSFWKDYREYERDTGRFITEFGFQAPANSSTLSAVLDPEDRRPQSPAMEYHNKQVEGTERLFRFQAAHLGVATDFEGFIERAQWVQAEALTTAVEHWRRRKFKTAGALFWQLNDCWPVSSWSVIDSALRPKAAYYAAKRFFTPVLLSLKRNGRWTEAWATNDRLRELPGVLTLRVLTFEGRELASLESKVSLKPNSSALLARIDAGDVPGFDPLTSYVSASLRTDAEPELRTRRFFAEPKHLRLPAGSVEGRLERRGEGLYGLHLKSAVLLRAIRISLDGEDTVFSDNWFDLDPAAGRSVTFQSTLDHRAVMKRLRIRSIVRGIDNSPMGYDVKRA